MRRIILMYGVFVPEENVAGEVRKNKIKGRQKFIGF
jgi:hypothetical protein